MSQLLDDASTQRPMFVHVLKYNRLEKTLARARRDNEAQALELNQLHARVLAAEQVRPSCCTAPAHCCLLR